MVLNHYTLINYQASNPRLGMSVTTQGGSGRQSVNDS